ncbi:MAG: ATP-binding cassette domain-containing protein, partial [Stellaceae bacterium]
MTEPLLEVRGLSKSFGGLLANDRIHLAVMSGEIHALIGPNGAGKTTFIGQIAGQIRPSAGVIRFDGRDITGLPSHARAALGLARSFQITSLFPTFTAFETVALAAQSRRGHSFRFWGSADGDHAVNE